MEKIIKNQDGSSSVVEVTTNTDGTTSEVVLSTTPKEVLKGSKAGYVFTPKGTVPTFVPGSSEQKFLEFTNEKGDVVRRSYVNGVKTVDFYADRSVTNLVVTDKSPLVSLVKVQSESNKAGVSIAKINFESDLLSKAVIYYSTAPVSVTLGVPKPIVTPIDAIKVELNASSLAHIATIKGLNANTVYYFVVYIKDELGNENVTLSDSFKTPSILI